MMLDDLRVVFGAKAAVCVPMFWAPGAVPDFWALIGLVWVEWVCFVSCFAGSALFFSLG